MEGAVGRFIHIPGDPDADVFRRVVVVPVIAFPPFQIIVQPAFKASQRGVDARIIPVPGVFQIGQVRAVFDDVALRIHTAASGHFIGDVIVFKLDDLERVRVLQMTMLVDIKVGRLKIDVVIPVIVISFLGYPDCRGILGSFVAFQRYSSAGSFIVIAVDKFLIKPKGEKQRILPIDLISIIFRDLVITVFFEYFPDIHAV